MNKLALLCGVCAAAIAASAADAQSQSTATNQSPPSDTVTPSPPANEATATGAAGQIQDIVVTAQRRSERLQNVPIAVTAANAAKLESVGVQTTQDLAIITPGLTVPQTAGFTQPHIRGIGSSTNGPGLEQPVATYIDGVYIASATSSLLTLNNVERIEVLKGPQGTLFGRNATGGLIQVITKDPSHTTGGAINVSYGNYNDVTGDAYATTGLTSTLAADVAVRYEHQGDNWGYNYGTGRGIGRLNHDLAVRTKFLYEPSDRTKIKLSFDYESRESSQDVQHLGTQYPGTFNNVVFGGPYRQGGFYDVNYSFDPRARSKGGGTSLQLTQDLGFATLQSITAYRRSSFSFPLDLDLTSADIISADLYTDDAQVSQELQLSSQGSGPLKWVAGFYYFHANDQWDPLNTNFGPSIISPVFNTPVVISTRDRQLTNAYAGYGQASYEFLPGTTFTAGLRYTSEHKAVSGTSATSVAGVVVNTIPVPDPSTGIADHAQFSRLNYRLSLDHRFGRNILAYISYNTGFKSGGFNIVSPTNPPYRPEDIKAVEGGIKSELFNRHLRLNAAGFHYDYQNIQVGRYTAGTEIIYNGAKAKLDGFDLDGEVVLSRGLSLNGGLSYVHARFSSFPNADQIVPIPGLPYNLGGIISASAKGNDLPFAPKTTFNVGVEYKVETRHGQFSFNATYFRSAKFYSSPDNVAFQKAYDLVNLSATWTLPGDRLSIKGYAKNLGGTHYFTSLAEGNQGLFYAAGAPRTYGATLGFKF